MANLITAPFTGGGAFPVDARLEKTKAEMLATNDNVMPENYFALCDGQIYLYQKSNAVDPETGKYRLFEGDGGTGDYSNLTNKPKLNGVTIEGEQTGEDFGLADADSVYTKDEVDAMLEGKVFVATYNVTTAAQILAYMDAAKEPFAPILVKRGSDYYTAILAAKSGSAGVILRVLGSGSGDFILFTYTITGNTWANSGYTFQKKLVSGTDIKTINGESILGSGNLEVTPDMTQYYNKTETDALLDAKADASSVYTKAETDTALDLKADKATTYTKAEVDALIPDVSDFVTDTELATALDEKADKSTTYTKAEVDALIPDVSDFATETELTDGLATKADAATTYTKTEVDTALSDKADAADVYTKTEADTLLDEKAGFSIAEISTAGGGTEVHAMLSQGEDTASFNYYKTTELPDTLNLNIGGDSFRVPTTGYVDGKGDSFYIFDTSNPPTFNEFKAVVDAGEQIVVVKYNGHYYAPMAYHYSDYPEEPLPVEVTIYLKTGVNSYRVLGYQNDKSEVDLPLTEVVNNSEFEAATMQSTYYPGIGSVSARFDKNAYRLDMSNYDEARLRTTFYNQAGLSKAIDTTIFPEYDVCIEDQVGSGNVIRIGSIKEGENQRGIFQFYYRTSALPNSGVQTYPLANLLANYTINSFIDATGITDNGIFIGNGRTDNNNRLIVQQFSKNNKNIQIRTYQDFSADTALLKVIFIGNKN